MLTRNVLFDSREDDDHCPTTPVKSLEFSIQQEDIMKGEHEKYQVYIFTNTECPRFTARRDQVRQRRSSYVSRWVNPLLPVHTGRAHRKVRLDNNQTRDFVLRAINGT